MVLPPTTLPKESLVSCVVVVAAAVLFELLVVVAVVAVVAVVVAHVVLSLAPQSTHNKFFSLSGGKVLS